MTNTPEPRPDQQPTDDAHVDDHPDAGMEEFGRTGREDGDLAEVDESPLPDKPGPGAAAAPVTSPPEDSR